MVLIRFRLIHNYMRAIVYDNKVWHSLILVSLKETPFETSRGQGNCFRLQKGPRERRHPGVKWVFLRLKLWEGWRCRLRRQQQRVNRLFGSNYLSIGGGEWATTKASYQSQGRPITPSYYCPTCIIKTLLDSQVVREN